MPTELSLSSFHALLPYRGDQKGGRGGPTGQGRALIRDFQPEGFREGEMKLGVEWGSDKEQEKTDFRILN